jgi:hypothetical protein
MLVGIRLVEKNRCCYNALKEHAVASSFIEQRDPPAIFTHHVRSPANALAVHVDSGGSGSPDGQNLLDGLEIRSLQVTHGLLIDCIIILLDTIILAQKW